MKIGDFEGAKSAFGKTFDLGCDDPQGLELFGLIQFKLGKYSDWVKTLTKVVEMNQGNARARKFIPAVMAQTENQTVGY